MRAEPVWDRQFTVPFAAALPLVVAMALVGIRGEIDPELSALILTLTVVAGARMAGRAGGLLAALTAAMGFDFFHTQPYLSLKIANGRDIATTVLLLLVGLAVGGVAGRAHRQEDSRWSRRTETARLTRVLAVAADGCAEDVSLSVRAELLGLLQLQDCRFTPELGHLSTLEQAGTIRISDRFVLRGDVALPLEGVALPVTWNHRCFGYLTAVPLPGAIVSAESRRVAVAMAEVLGLAMAAEPAAA